MTDTSAIGRPYIHIYSRYQAIADGVLIDADSLEEGFAAQAGFMVPVAITAAAWADAVAWSKSTAAAKSQAGQDEKGRLWDVFTMARHAIRRGGADRQVTFEVLRIPATGRKLTPTLTELVMDIGPGDLGEPVITIMLPWED